MIDRRRFCFFGLGVLASGAFDPRSLIRRLVVPPWSEWEQSLEAVASYGSAEWARSVHVGDGFYRVDLSAGHLDRDAIHLDGFYDGQVLIIASGRGAGQVRTIHSYDGKTQRARVTAPWDIPPDDASRFVLMGGAL